MSFLDSLKAIVTDKQMGQEGRTRKIKIDYDKIF
jgi:hypothetical protein